MCLAQDYEFPNIDPFYGPIMRDRQNHRFIRAGYFKVAATGGRGTSHPKLPASRLNVGHRPISLGALFDPAKHL
jgi:hypothetical protein